jgi:hypothetical protein
MIGAYVHSELDCRRKRITPDSVGMGSYTLDSHNVRRYVTPDGTVQNEGDIGVHCPRPYEVAYGALVPKKGQGAMTTATMHSRRTMAAVISTVAIISAMAVVSVAIISEADRNGRPVPSAIVIRAVIRAIIRVTSCRIWNYICSTRGRCQRSLCVSRTGLRHGGSLILRNRIRISCCCDNGRYRRLSRHLYPIALG